MHQFRPVSPSAGRSRSSRSRGYYVFSCQRHFTSTIFADQILIVGWRLSKEAWPSRLVHFQPRDARTHWLPFSYFSSSSPASSCSPCSALCAAERSAVHRDILAGPSSHLSRSRRNGVRTTRMLIASSYQNRR